MKIINEQYRKIYFSLGLLMMIVLRVTPEAIFNQRTNKYMDSKNRDFSLKVQKIMEKSQIRPVREVKKQYENSDVYHNKGSLLTSPAVAVWFFLEIDGFDYLFAGTKDGYIWLYDNSSLIPLLQFPREEPLYDLKGFNYGNSLWLIGFHQSDQKSYVQLYQYDFSNLEARQKILIHQISLIDITQFENSLFLIIASDVSTPVLQLFKWNGTQFDYVRSSPLQGKPKSLSTWLTEKYLNVAVSYTVRSLTDIPKFTLSTNSRNVITVQIFELNCIIMKYYKTEEDHYVVCGNENNFIQYWWNGMKFVEHRNISSDTGNIVDIAVLVYPNNTLYITVAKKNILEFYMQTKSVPLTRLDVIKLPASKTIKSIQLCRKQQEFYLLPVFQDYMKPLIYPIDFDIYSLKIASLINAPILKKCISNMELRIQIMNEKLNEVQDNLTFAWMKTDYISLLTVNVKGSIFSKAKVDIEEISFSNKSDIPKLLPTIDFYKNLTDKVSVLKSLLEKVVMKRKTQTIHGNIHFSNTVRGMQVNISNLESHANLNGVNTVDLNSTIKITGSHVFLSEVLISSGLFTTVNTHTLNSVPISDYMMLNDSHLHVNGSFKLSHLTVQNINLRAINTIDPKTFFLSTGNQVVMEQKTFNYLLCDVISAKNFMHNLNITDYAKNVIRIGNMMYKEMIIDGDFTILDNLIVKRINGKDLSKLFLASVKRNKIETIKGKKIFYEPVKIKDMSILGYINNFDFNHLFTLKTSQTLPGTFFFTKFSPNSIATNSINGIDFSQDAVLMFGMSVVKRKVHFLQPVIVLDIIVENNGTINALKLSKEIQYLPQKNFTVFTKDFIFKNLIVENSINITDSRIENILLTLKNNVWLKKKFQNVSEGRYRRLLTQNLQVQTVNGISLQDIVLTISDSHINSEKIFLNDVHLSSMASTSREKLINIDDAFVTKNFSFIFKDMHVKGNIDVPVLNNVLMSDLMHTKKLQICKGRTAFDRVQLKSLLSKNLKFSTFKDKNIDNYFLSTLMPQKHILSAKFMNIKAMKLVVTGFLNRKDLNRLYDSVVTLDSNQKILATCMFSSSLNLKVLNVSNLIDLNSVVLRDVSSLIISRKEFIGSFSAENLWLDGKINNVSINDLSMNAFLKNSRNIIQKVITFQSNFSTPSLKVDLNATLDHVMFSELLKVEDPLHADAFQISSVYVKNLTFNGQINQCGSFSELFESALQKNKGQTFLMSKNFNSLNIDGNLFLEKDINGLSAHDINHKLSFLEGENESKNYKFFNVRAIWLRVSNYFNGIDVDFILKDSITKEGTEEIAGRKKFTNLFLKSLNVLNIKSDAICGVDIVLLASNYVSRTKRNQKLFLSKLPEMYVKNAIFEKQLNGLKLPEDLVLTNSDEIIAFPVYFQNATRMSSDLIVFGSLDGVNISQLLRNKVSLSDFSNLQSSLKFLDNTNILGNLAINGLVNNIHFSNVIKLSGFSVVHSRKAFNKHLFIPKITVLGSINNKSVKALSQIVSKYHEAANFSKLVQFFNLNLSSLLITDDVNDVPMTNLWNSVHIVEEKVYESLDKFSEVINQHNKDLYDIEDGVNYHPSSFGFFILHQLLNVGTSVQALPFYESGVSGSASDVFSLQIIIWTKQNATCSYFKSIIMDIHPNGTLEKSDTVNGRLFPFTLGLFEENVKGLMFHSDRRIPCIGEDKENVIKTIYFNGDTHPSTITSPHNSEVVDAKFIELDTGVFLLVAYNMKRDGEKLYLYEHDPFKDIWSIHQKFHSWNISSVDIMYLDDFDSNEIYLAVTGDGTESGIHLYTWDFDDNLFGFKFDIPESTAGIVLWVRVDKSIYLLHAEEKTMVQQNHVWVDTYTESVKVYLLDDLDDLIVDHTINVQGISSLEQFKLLGETYVLGVSHHSQMVYIIQHRGFNGFEVIQEINAPGVVHAKIYVTPNHDLFIIISSTTGHTRILKSAIRGSAHVE